MHIYTRKGDNGTTSLLGGKKVSKSHLRIETYGTVDELIAYIGLLRDQGISEEIRKQLMQIQDKLMQSASLLAAGCAENQKDLPKLCQKDISYLEDAIDAMDQELEPLKSFILPGGHPTVSFCHITRCVCRRAERQTSRLHKEDEIPVLVMGYLNRLSDYLFVLARKLSKDLDIREIIWDPK